MKETFEETTATLERQDPPQLEQGPERNSPSEANIAVEHSNPEQEPIMTDTATARPGETASGDRGVEGEAAHSETVHSIETSAENV